MRLPAAVLLGALVLLPGARRAALASDDDTPSIERELVDLRLGDSLEDVQRIYPPAQEWPSFVEPKHHVTRMRVERSMLKSPDKDVETMWLGFKHDRLVEMQLIYDDRYTRAESVDGLVKHLSLIYGEPGSDNDRFWWADGRTVLRVFYAKVPMVEGGERAVELHTSVQLAEAWLFKR